VDTMHGAVADTNFYMRENFDEHAAFLTPIALLTSATAMNGGKKAVAGDGIRSGRIDVVKLAVYYPILLRWDEMRDFAKNESLPWPLEETKEAAVDWFVQVGSQLKPKPLTHLNEGGTHDLAWFKQTVMNETLPRLGRSLKNDDRTFMPGAVPNASDGRLHTLLWDGEFLLRTRVAARNSANAATVAAVTALHSVATSHLRDGPFSVLDKGFLPPSGDKRDFMTLSAYYWPCNETCNKTLAPDGDCSRFCGGANNYCNYTAIPSGCPNSKSWCNNGSHVYSPNSGKGGDCSCSACNHATGLPWSAHDGYNWPHATDDRGEVDKLWAAVIPLTLAWFYSGEQAFLDRSVVLLRAWFTSTTTSMRPNMRFADTIPGIISCP
jgi:hypothetical protein